MSKRVPFYKRRFVQIGAVVVAIPLLALAWWLGSPLFIDQVVDEPFPRAAMAVVPDDMSASEVEQEMIEAETTDTPVYEDMPEPVPAAATTLVATTTTAGGTTEESNSSSGEADTTPTTADEAGTTPATTEETPEAPAAPEPTGPVALLAGTLMDGDSFHKGSGEIILYRLEDGSLLLRMEDIEVTNGPQLHVILTPVPGVQGRDDVHATGYLDLGRLKGNVGSQNYELPADYEIPANLTVVIYCVPFSVVFATAPLA